MVPFCLKARKVVFSPNGTLMPQDWQIHLVRSLSIPTAEALRPEWV